MLVRRSLAVALAVAFVSGCGGSNNYSATDVAKALRNHGFGTEVMTKDEWELLQTFPLPLPKGVVNVIADREQPQHSTPGPRATLVLEALIYDAEGHASCESNVLGTCLRKRNVVVFVRKRRAQAAREALADLK